MSNEPESTVRETVRLLCAAVLGDRGLAWRCGELHSTDGQHGEHGHGCGAYVCGRHEHAHDCPNEYDYEIVTGAAPQEGQ